jgi:hypothetical protein
MDERSGWEVKSRLAGQMSIFNTEAQAIIEAIKITRRWGVDSNIVAQEGTFTRGNKKKMVLNDLMAEEGSNLELMWVRLLMWPSWKMKRRTRQQK